MAISKEMQKAADKAAKVESYWKDNGANLMIAFGIGFFFGFVAAIFL